MANHTVDNFHWINFSEGENVRGGGTHGGKNNYFVIIKIQHRLITELDKH